LFLVIKNILPAKIRLFIETNYLLPFFLPFHKLVLSLRRKIKTEIYEEAIIPILNGVLLV